MRLLRYDLNDNFATKFYTSIYIYALFNQNVAKAIAEKLLKVSIYPTTEELRDVTKEYMEEHHRDFLKKFNKAQWSGFYERNIYSTVSLRNLHNIS